MLFNPRLVHWQQQRRECVKCRTRRRSHDNSLDEVDLFRRQSPVISKRGRRTPAKSPK
jgi:hypothetical protein